MSPGGVSPGCVLLAFPACVPLFQVCVLPLPVCEFPVCALSVWDPSRLLAMRAFPVRVASSGWDPSHLLAMCAFPVRVASSGWDPSLLLALSALPACVILFPVRVESHQ